MDQVRAPCSPGKAATRLALRSRPDGDPVHELRVGMEAAVGIAVNLPFVGDVLERDAVLWEQLWRRPPGPSFDGIDATGDVAASYRHELGSAGGTEVSIDLDSDLMRLATGGSAS